MKLPPDSDSMVSDEGESIHPALRGIGGWLFLLAIGVLAAPGRVLMDLAQIATLMSNSWEVLTTPDSAAYHPLWGPLLVGGLIANVLLCGAAVLQASLFFTKHRAFPKVAITLMLVGLAVPVAQNLIGSVIPAVSAAASWGDFMPLYASSIMVMVWIGYLVRSKRVKATFTNTWNVPLSLRYLWFRLTRR